MQPRRDPLERSSTDEGLRSERKKTDAELALQSKASRDATTDAVADAREKADSVLSDTRDREDLETGRSAQLTREREREDADRRTERSGADDVARNEVERRRTALASLLAFEREDTDLRLKIERKQADRALSSREDFMEMVSHDLRSLLAGIALSAEMLKDVAKSEQPFVQVTRYAERIQLFGARMTRLVGDLMDVASIEAGKLALRRTPQSPAVLLRDARDAFKPVAAAHAIELTCASEEGLGLVELDHERILQVLTNLVGNALKFTPRGGRIAIEVARREDAICFSVADTGSGIPTALLEKIFERYFQSVSGDRRGLGLGLFIAKSIVEGHGGAIWATSTPGEGSTIYFTLP